MDGGLITINYRGSYAKQPQRTGTRGREPSDRDLMALDEEVWRSNLGRGSEIERLRVKGARAAALAAPTASLAAAACRSSWRRVLEGCAGLRNSLDRLGGGLRECCRVRGTRLSPAARKKLNGGAFSPPSAAEEIAAKSRPRVSVEGSGGFTEPWRCSCAGRSGAECNGAAVPRRRRISSWRRRASGHC